MCSAMARAGRVRSSAKKSFTTSGCPVRTAIASGPSAYAAPLASEIGVLPMMSYVGPADATGVRSAPRASSIRDERRHEAAVRDDDAAGFGEERRPLGRANDGLVHRRERPVQARDARKTLLDLLALRDVVEHRERALDAARVAAKQRRRDEQPPRDPIVAVQADLVALRAIDSRLASRALSRRVREYLRQAASHEIGSRVEAEQARAGVVRERDGLGGVGDEDPLARGVEDKGKPALALAKLRLDPRKPVEQPVELGGHLGGFAGPGNRGARREIAFRDASRCRRDRAHRAFDAAPGGVRQDAADEQDERTENRRSRGALPAGRERRIRRHRCDRYPVRPVDAREPEDLVVALVAARAAASVSAIQRDANDLGLRGIGPHATRFGNAEQHAARPVDQRHHAARAGRRLSERREARDVDRHHQAARDAVLAVTQRRSHRNHPPVAEGPPRQPADGRPSGLDDALENGRVGETRRRPRRGQRAAHEHAVAPHRHGVRDVRQQARHFDELGVATIRIERAKVGTLREPLGDESRVAHDAGRVRREQAREILRRFARHLDVAARLPLHVEREQRDEGERRGGGQQEELQPKPWTIRVPAVRESTRSARGVRMKTQHEIHRQRRKHHEQAALRGLEAREDDDVVGQRSDQPVGEQDPQDPERQVAACGGKRASMRRASGTRGLGHGPLDSNGRRPSRAACRATAQGLTRSRLRRAIMEGFFQRRDWSLDCPETPSPSARPGATTP